MKRSVREFSTYIQVAALLGFLFFGVIGAMANDSPPDWITQATVKSSPAYDKDVKAVVLYKEQNVTLDGSGKLITTERTVIRVLTHDGRKEAVAMGFYLADFSQVKDIQAWLIRTGTTPKAYGKKETIDLIADKDDVYNEGRLKIIDASGDADTNSVFGYTITTEDKPLFYQDKWHFQDDLPTLFSRYTLTLPDGWKATSLTFNHADVPAQVSGTTYTWELRDLPPIKREPMSPSFANLVPRIAVNYSPANSDQGVNRVFPDWIAVSRWASSLQDPSVVVDDAIAAKARDLTAGADTEMDKIRMVGSYVQKLQYIAIDIGVGYGNGMRPRASNVVLNRGYGDCKDKANLMRAMLKALKIDAYPIAIYSGDPSYVRKEWPSPDQFNHCIIAIKVSDQVKAPTVIDHPALGRLLIFDATDEFTPVGDLPDYLQGSYGLLAAGDNGGLIEMPVTPADFNSWSRETDVTMDASGSIKGTIRERTTGQEAKYAREMFRSLPPAEFNKAIQDWLSRGASAARLDKLTPDDKQTESAFNMDVEFAAPAYGQLMQNHLLVFRPAIASRTNSIYLTDKDRNNPVLLESNSFSEKVTFNLPQGFAVDETPSPVNLETLFGKYTTTYEVKDGKLLFTRLMITKRTVVPADKYGGVRDFFSKIRDAEQAPVVLIRK